MGGTTHQRHGDGRCHITKTRATSVAEMARQRMKSNRQTNQRSSLHLPHAYAYLREMCRHRASPDGDIPCAPPHGGSSLPPTIKPKPMHGHALTRLSIFMACWSSCGMATRATTLHDNRLRARYRLAMKKSSRRPNTWRVDEPPNRAIAEKLTHSFSDRNTRIPSVSTPAGAASSTRRLLRRAHADTSPA